MCIRDREEIDGGHRRLGRELHDVGRAGDVPTAIAGGRKERPVLVVGAVVGIERHVADAGAGGGEGELVGLARRERAAEIGRGEHAAAVVAIGRIDLCLLYTSRCV